MRVGIRSREPARVLCADPPWQFGDKLTMAATKRGAGSNYSTMSLAEVKAFMSGQGMVPYPVADDALLFLWSVAAMKEEALDVMRAWGFAPKSEIVWVKTTKDRDGTNVMGAPVGDGRQHLAFGMGRYVRNCHETCLIGRRGKATVQNRSVRSVFFALAGRHSAKPEAFYDIVEKLSPGPYVELFARRRRPGWRCYGDEL